MLYWELVMPKPPLFSCFGHGVLSQQGETKLIFPFVVRSNNSYPLASHFLTTREALILALRALRL